MEPQATASKTTVTKTTTNPNNPPDVMHQKPTTTTTTNVTTNTKPSTATTTTLKDATQTFNSPFALLTQDHRTIEKLYNDILQTKDLALKKELTEQLIRIVVIHSVTEETRLYPKLDKLSPAISPDKRDAMIKDHQNVDTHLRELEQMDINDIHFDTKLKNALDTLLAHAKEEEMNIFPLLEKSMSVEDQDRMLAKMQRVRDFAPTITHPHPDAPSFVRSSVVAGSLVGLLDRTRDLFGNTAARRNPLGV